MTNYTFENLTDAQNRLMERAIVEWDVFVHARQFKTAEKLESLGLGRCYFKQGQMTGKRFVMNKDWRDSIEVLEKKVLPFGTYLTVKVVSTQQTIKVT